MSRIICADAAAGLKTLLSESVRMCVTSPPYYGLRDYGTDGQIGIEQTPKEYIDRLVEVFAEVYRVLKPDGTLWLNISDSYAGNGKGIQKNREKIKPKDMIGIPWMLAFALREFGYYLRSDIIWHKINGLPENVKDRPAKSYEHIFLLTKSPKYYYDYKAIQEPIKAVTAGAVHARQVGKSEVFGSASESRDRPKDGRGNGRKQTVQKEKGRVGSEYEHLSHGRAFCDVSRKAHRAVHPCGEQSGGYSA